MMRKSVLGFAALATVLAIGLGLSAGSPSALAAPATSEAAAAPGIVSIENAAFTEDQDGARLVLAADGPVFYTSYEPRPDLLVIELAGTRRAPGFVAPTVSGNLIQAVDVDDAAELGKTNTRISITHRAGLHYDISSQGRTLAIAFDAGSAPPVPDGPAVAAPEPKPVPESGTSESPASPAVSPSKAPTPAVATSAPPAVSSEPLPAASTSPASAVEPAHALESVGIRGKGDAATVVLLADGALKVRDFVLTNPPRIVLDLEGIRNEVKHRSLTVHEGAIERVRVSQFSSRPRVTRVVVDLDHAMPYHVNPDGETVSVSLGAAAAAAAEPTSAASAVPAPPSRTTVAETPSAPTPAAATPQPPSGSNPPEQPAPAVAASAAPSGASQEKPASSTPASASAGTDSAAGSAPAAAENASAASDAAKPPEGAAEMAATSPEPAATSPEPAKTAAESAAATPEPMKSASGPEKTAEDASPAVPTEPSTDARPLVHVPRGAARDSIPSGERARGVLEAQRKTRTSLAPAPKRKEQDQALFEAAAAVLDQEEGKTKKSELPNTFQSKTLGTESQYSGEPIDLNLKDADIKDVFRTISELTGLNIVIDPDVKGTVTVRLTDVPWDQALELILKENGLGYVLENNVMRIAPVGKLQQEEQQRVALEEARQQSIPTKTIIKKLSYADATQAAGTLRQVMSKRGDVIVDSRTNTLIIREIPSYLPTVIQLLDNLDTPTPQVMIETRIVETTKTFGRNLGISWGISGSVDQAHGNTTNLSFPNTITGFGGTGPASVNVNLNNGANLLALRLGNVLDTFDLDLALQAAENEGLAKVISSPRVEAMTNKRAYIQSGVQIPVQTTVNNTTTVVYVDATLRLEVTPQITAEGTVLLDVRVTKRDPAVALNVSQGQNVPITIREAQTQVLVKDGGTAVIGGIFILNDQTQHNYIPGLWKIPILGSLFKNETITNKHDELLIFITPRIIHQ
jgi:type IV pilus assembly protein PilQ